MLNYAKQNGFKIRMSFEGCRSCSALERYITWVYVCLGDSHFSGFVSDKLRRVAGDVAARIPPPPQPSLVQMYLHHVDTEEVERMVRSAPPKSSSLDFTSESNCPRAMNVHCLLNAQLTNLSFTAGVFSSGYRLGHVTPLLKKPSLPKDDPANYRPIQELIIEMRNPNVTWRIIWHIYLFTAELRHTCSDSDTCTPKYLWSNAYISNGRRFTKSAFVSCYYPLSVFLE